MKTGLTGLKTAGEGVVVPAAVQPRRATPSNDEYQRGLLTVGTITLFFASNSPVLHAAFANTDSAPPVLLLNAAVSVVALVGLLFGGPLLGDTVPLASTLEPDASTTFDQTSARAGFELGCWKMLGTTANLYGLSLTSADHGAFLIQLTTLIVPLVQGIRGTPIPPRIWSAVALAIGGLWLFTQDPESAMSASSLGDGLCILAACMYATYDLRLFYWGRRVTPLPLITTKSARPRSAPRTEQQRHGSHPLLVLITSVAPPLPRSCSAGRLVSCPATRCRRA